MAKQSSNSADFTSYEKKLLMLEKEYTELLYEFIRSDFFINQLKKLFIDLNNDTDQVRSLYSGKSFFNTPAERFVTYCFYVDFLNRKQEGDSRFEEVLCYSYPICGDLAIELKNVVLDIEVKTVNRFDNTSDVSSLQFRPNQTSFTNVVTYGNADESTGYKPQFIVKGHLPKFQKDKPVLTYVIEILYTYNKDDARLPFNFFDGVYNDCTALNLFCIPNGELSRLFEFDIFQGVKTYSYYDALKTAPPYYDIIYLDNDIFPNLSSCLENLHSTYDYLYNNISKINSNWKIANQTDHILLIDTEHKGPASHEKEGILWTLTKVNGKPCLRAIRNISTSRIDWQNNLVERYDENGNCWDGVRHITIR